MRCGALALLFVAGQDGYKTLSYNRGKDSRMGRDSRKDKNEGSLDKAKGWCEPILPDSAHSQLLAFRACSTSNSTGGRYPRLECKRFWL